MSANRLPLMLDGLLAAGAWALLLVLMNSVPPTLGTEIVFLVLFAAAVALTVVLLAGFIGKAVAPQALGKPYLKER